MIVVGLDVGERRIGVARGDDEVGMAFPLEVVQAGDTARAVARIREICAESDAGKIVVGNPVSLKGETGRQAEKVLAFAEELKKGLAREIVMWDERLSTVQAERVLLEADVSRKKRKEKIDKLSAQVILQNYFDSQKRKDEGCTS